VGYERERERAREGGNDCGVGVWGGAGRCGVGLQCIAGLVHPGRGAKLDLSFAPQPGSVTFFVCPQHCAGEKSRPNKHRIPSKSRLGGEFLSSPGLPNTPECH
jgi:hypothetical protein